MMIKNCDLCGLPFPADESWKRQCLSCWKEEKGYTPTKADKALVAMREAYAELKKDLIRAERKNAQFGRSRPNPVGGLSQGHVNTLIRLCHPDKHKGSPKATEMTKWLLAQRVK
jgi:hypothetical protein